MRNIPSNSSPLVIVCGSDDKYALPLAVTLASALRSLSPETEVTLLLLDGGISKASEARLRRVIAQSHRSVDLQWFRSDTEQFQGLTAHTWITPSTYLRFLAPDILPSNFSRAIYLDSDLLVQVDLTELWNQDMHCKPLMAVQDPIVQTISGEEGLANYSELGLSPDLPYFNAGVLVMDLNRWRKESLGQKIMTYIRDYAAIIRFDDQEGLNAVLAGNWVMLEPRWNLMANTLWPGDWADDSLKARALELRQMLAKPNICHFAGQSKPWRPSCSYPIKSTWLRCLSESGWFTPEERLRWFVNYSVRHHGFRLKQRLKSAK